MTDFRPLTARLGDACQGHFPGDLPATLPGRVTMRQGSLRAEYCCRACARQWVTWWDPGSVEWPWPLRRDDP